MIWRTTLNGCRYVAWVERIDWSTGYLRVQEVTSFREICTEVVTLEFGAELGPTEDDADRWSMRALRVCIEHDQERSSRG
jgi:hypothetical protein